MKCQQFCLKILTTWLFHDFTSKLTTFSTSRWKDLKVKKEKILQMVTTKDYIINVIIPQRLHCGTVWNIQGYFKVKESLNINHV